jgi:hypothetical protein
MRLFGRFFRVQIAYCALVSGVATLLTYLIVKRVIGDRLPGPGRMALWLCVPLSVLGVYGVYPHPFYDPDCSAVILLALLGLLVCHDRGWPRGRSLLAGTVLPLPLFIKQNTGGAFLVLTCTALLLSALPRSSTRQRAGIAWALGGALISLLAGLAALHATAGLQAVFHWTVTFAAGRRLRMSLLGELRIYRALFPWAALATALAGVLVWRARTTPLARATSLALLLLPFGMVIARAPSTLFPEVGRLGVVAIWPYVLLVSALLGFWRLARRGPSFVTLMPLVLVGVVHGALLSQGVVGSTYGLWPLLVILLACDAVTVAEALPRGGADLMRSLLPLSAAALLIGGTVYVWRNQRLAYARVHVRPVQRATHPSLVGLATGGHYLGELDQLLAFCERTIPPGEPVLALPGEDPLYFALDRLPPLPITLFDRTTNNPYSVDELLRFVDTRGVRWVIVKTELQFGFGFSPWPDQKLFEALLAPTFAPVATLGHYRILRRREPADVGAESSGDRAHAACWRCGWAVLEHLRGEKSVAELCQARGVALTAYWRLSGRRRFAGPLAAAAQSPSRFIIR